MQEHGTIQRPEDDAQPRLLPAQPLRLTHHEDYPLNLLPPDAELAGPGPTPGLLHSLTTLGQLQPIVAAASGGRVTRIVAGRRRVKGARALAWETVSAYVFPEDGMVDATVSLGEQAHHTANPLADLDVIERLLAQDLTVSDVSRATGLPVQSIRQRLRLRALTPGLRAGVEAGTLTMTAATEAARLPDEVQGRLGALLAAGEKVTVKAVRQARQVHVTAQAQDVLSAVQPLPVPAPVASDTAVRAFDAPRPCSGCGGRAHAGVFETMPICGACAEQLVAINAQRWSEEQ